MTLQHRLGIFVVALLLAPHALAGRTLQGSDVSETVQEPSVAVSQVPAAGVTLAGPQAVPAAGVLDSVPQVAPQAMPQTEPAAGVAEGVAQATAAPGGPSAPQVVPGAPQDLLDTQFDDRFEMAEDELLVAFKSGTTEEKKGKAFEKGKAAEKQLVRAGDGMSGDLSLVKVQLEAGQPGRAHLKAAARRIQADEDVLYAEPNFIYKTLQAPVPNDPDLGQLWGMLGGNGADAAGAWAKGYTDCSNVVVGVLDSGIQITHPDLADNIWINPGEIAGNGIDDDQNGKIDDVNGWDFYSSTAGDGSVYDDIHDGHGTHVAGTIGGVGNNGLGVAGVCQRGVKIIPVKFLGGVGGSGTLDSAVAALDYVLTVKENYNLYLVATSNSWGGAPFSESLRDAIQRHNDAGILFIAAAGNDGRNNDITPSYPASYDVPNIISVGAITSSGDGAWFTNYGSTSVDLFAPGLGIYSTWPVDTYKSISGTSMSTPHVTGAAALYAAAHKATTGVYPPASLIKAAILTTGVQDTRYQDISVSGMRLSISRLVANETNDTPPMGMTAQMTLTTTQSTINKKKFFRCTVTVTVKDTAGNSVPGVSAAGRYTVNPDGTCTDPSNRFPTINKLSFSGSVSVVSPDIPVAAKCGSTKGAFCTFTLDSVTADGFTLMTALLLAISSTRL